MTRKLKNIKCTHCKNLFLPSRKGHKFCSETCRKSSHKAHKTSTSRQKLNRRIAEKLRKLAASNYGQYLVRELKRAGSIQVLTGHTHSSLKELAELRRRCNADGGFKDGKALRAYELSHIYPVQHDFFMGLLHPKNLVIASKEFNRRHSTRIPTHPDAGLTILRTELVDVWNVRERQSSLEVLKNARKFLGLEFDVWLKSHLIVAIQKTNLIKKLSKAGLERKTLKDKTFSELRAINMAIEEDVATTCWTLSTHAKDRFSIALRELNRLGIEGELTDSLRIVEQDYWSLDDSGWRFQGKEFDNYLEALSQEAELLLHGQPYKKTWKSKPFSDWWKRMIESRTISSINLSDEPL